MPSYAAAFEGDPILSEPKLFQYLETLRESYEMPLLQMLSFLVMAHWLTFLAVFTNLKMQESDLIIFMICRNSTVYMQIFSQQLQREKTKKVK